MNTLKSKSKINEMFRLGTRYRFSAVHFIIQGSNFDLAVDGGVSKQGAIAFIAGKKLGSAPLRSRSKRVLREAARRNKLSSASQDLICLATRKTALASPQILDKEFQRFIAIVSDKSKTDKTKVITSTAATHVIRKRDEHA